MKVASGYAEMFEWEDGNPDMEDRTGCTVSLVGDKIKICQSNEMPIGVIGGDNTSVAAISNGSPQEWAGKHVRDQYGRLLWEGQTMVEWIDNGYRHWYETDRLPEGITIPTHATYYYEWNGHPLQREILTKEYNNPNKVIPPYLPRWDRKEWGVVVLLGRVVIREDAIKSLSWKKLKTISNEPGMQPVSEWLVQ